MSQEDRDYYLERARQERQIAVDAADDYAKVIHLKLAALYERRAIEGGSAEMDDDTGSFGTPLVQ